MSRSQDRDGTLRVLSYNIRRGLGMDGRQDLRRVADVIDRIDPDVVGLQEIDRNCERSGFVDQAATLADHLGMEFVFEPAIELPGADAPGQYGVAALSAAPIRRVAGHPLPENEESEPRVLLETRVDLADTAVAGDSVTFAVTHLGLDAPLRERQASALVDATGSPSTIVVGDFNATPESAPIETMIDRYTDAFAAAGIGDVPTFPSPYAQQEQDGSISVRVPQNRIDYVFCSPDIAVVDATRYESLASDHCPVVADIDIDP